MIIYLAGELPVPVYARHRLHSFHGLKPDKVNAELSVGTGIAMDSGAFSAYTRKVVIDVTAYAEFLAVHGRWFDWYATLDVIGDSEGTWKNQELLEAVGLRPVPAFHFGADPKYIHKLLDNYDHIAIGGLAIAGYTKLEPWLDKVFDRYLTDGAGRPRAKFHGFALTSVPVMRKFPWHSTDSSTWVQMAGNRGIVVPRNDHGRPDYTRGPKQYALSRGQGGNLWSGHVSPSERDWVAAYVWEMGFPIGFNAIEVHGPDWLPPTMMNARRLEPHRVAHLVTVPDGKVPWEVAQVPGLCNDIEMRLEYLAKFYETLADNIPSDRVYERRRGTKRLF